MTLELKSELVQVRQTGATSTGFAASDALFSLDLEGIVDMMDPGRNQFTVMELVGYKVDIFPSPSTNTTLLEAAMFRNSSATQTKGVLCYRAIDFDTSVPDASQATTAANFINTEERWIASATKIARDSTEWAIYHLSDGTSQNGAAITRNGTDFSRDWVDLRNFDGKGILIAAPRLIVRYSLWIDTTANLASTIPDPNEIFQLRLRYKTRKINKNQMWQMLLQQTPGETLIRSGSAAFP